MRLDVDKAGRVRLTVAMVDWDGRLGEGLTLDLEP